MLQGIEKEIKEFSLEESKELYKTNTYPDQRTFRKEHGQRLAQAMIDGEFGIGRIDIVEENHNSGKRLLVNGQHQLWAAIKTGLPFEALYTVTKTHDAAETARIYARHDNNLPRNLIDQAKPLARALGINWPNDVIKKFIQAMAILDGQERLVKYKKIEILAGNQAEQDFIQKHLCPTGKSHSGKKYIYKTPVIAAMIESFRLDSVSAELFWPRVISGIEIEQGDPTLALREWLISTIGLKLTYNPIREACNIAWNCYMANRPLDRLPHFRKKIKSVTPMKAGRK